MLRGHFWDLRAVGFSSAVSLVAGVVPACIKHRETVIFRALCVSAREKEPSQGPCGRPCRAGQAVRNLRLSILRARSWAP